MWLGMEVTIYTRLIMTEYRDENYLDIYMEEQGMLTAKSINQVSTLNQIVEN